MKTLILAIFVACTCFASDFLSDKGAEIERVLVDAKRPTVLPVDPLKVIEEHGFLRFTDGSSIYTFRKSGDFTLEPLGISGRTIKGKWQRFEGGFRVEGEWSWMNGGSIPDDFRSMTLYVYPTDFTEIVGYQKQECRKVYFTIEEILKKK